MQRDRPVPRGFEERRREILRFRAFEQLERNPARLIRVPIRRDLLTIARPPEAIAGLIGALISLDGIRHVLFVKSVIPQSIARDLEDLQLHRERIPNSFDPVPQRPPHLPGVARAHSLEHHLYLQRVVSPHAALLAPSTL